MKTQKPFNRKHCRYFNRLTFVAVALEKIEKNSLRNIVTFPGKLYCIALSRASVHRDNMLNK